VADFSFRDRVAQFWNRTVGKLIPRLQVRTWADKSIDAVPVAEMAAGLADKTLTVDAWEAQMREHVKREYIRQALAGRGGLGKMDPRSWGSVGGQLAEQYKYLDKFAREIASGNLSEGVIRRRMEMYINSAREAFEREQRKAAEASDLNEVRWMLDPSPTVEHCTGNPGCLELSQMGWQKLRPWPFRVGAREIYPATGDTPCLTSCRCRTIYRRVR
jgi:hypothetical protein